MKGDTMTIDPLKRAALDHLKDCRAASFMEKLEDGLWLCVGTREAIAERVFGEPVAHAATDWMRSITETELALIPNKDGRRDRVRAMYRIPLYATPPQAKEEG